MNEKKFLDFYKSSLTNRIKMKNLNGFILHRFTFCIKFTQHKKNIKRKIDLERFHKGNHLLKAFQNKLLWSLRFSFNLMKYFNFLYHCKPVPFFKISLHLPTCRYKLYTDVSAAVNSL